MKTHDFKDDNAIDENFPEYFKGYIDSNGCYRV